MSNAAAALPRADADSSRLERVSLARASDRLIEDWRAFERALPPGFPEQDPEWLRGYFEGELEQITSYVFQGGPGPLSGVASFLRKSWPMRLHLGEVSLAELPLRRLRLLGGAPSLPDDEALYDQLFRELAADRGYDAIHFAQVPTDSFLWKYLTGSKLVGRCFRRYLPEEPSLHPLLRFPGSFEEYMKANFSKTHRHTLRRKVSRFQEESGGMLRLVRYTAPEEVAAFLKPAVEVSRRTYQWNLHGRGLRATELFERRYGFAAHRGWFRSYMLFRGDEPCAFLGGYQWRGRYYTDEIGFDPAFTRHSPGTVLQMMVIEDMFAFDKPEMIDFGSYDRYKEEFANDSYTHCAMLLFRPGLYGGLVRLSDAGCRAATKAAVGVAQRLNLKSRLKKTVRERSTSQERG